MTDYYHYLGMTGMNMENIIKEILSDGLLGENREKLDSGAGESFIAKLLIPFLTEYHKVSSPGYFTVQTKPANLLNFVFARAAIWVRVYEIRSQQQSTLTRKEAAQFPK